MDTSPKRIILKTEDLSVGYGKHVLFKSLDLEITAGKLICFMGPNGSGKSTIIRTLAGLQPPLEGRVDYYSLEGKIVKRTTNHVALVLTDPVYAMNMTVLELVTFGRYPYLDWNIRLRKKDKEMIEHSIEMVRIGYLKDKRLNELSDGQRQMAMIARALAQETPLIILDEPTAHLDLNNRVEVMKLLRRLASETDKGILLATHELDLALQTADLIWLTGSEHNIIQGIPEDLVLNGAFDRIFQFKGFDLKTGKVQHEPYRKTRVTVEGEGFVFLWTKSALQRTGFETTANGGQLIEIKSNGDAYSWHSQGKAFLTLEDLILHLAASG